MKRNTFKGDLEAIIFGVASEKIMMTNVTNKVATVNTQCPLSFTASSISIVDKVVNAALNKLLPNKLKIKIRSSSFFNINAYFAHDFVLAKLISRCSDTATVAVSKHANTLAINKIPIRTTIYANIM